MSGARAILRRIAVHAVPPYARLDKALNAAHLQLAALSEEHQAKVAEAAALRSKYAALQQDMATAGFPTSTEVAEAPLGVQYGIDRHWCDSSGLYLEGWIQCQDAPVDTLSMVAGSQTCLIRDLLPRSGIPTRAGPPPSHGASGFKGYLPWHASDRLFFEVTAAGRVKSLAVDLPAGPIEAPAWSHSEPAPPQRNIFGAEELGKAFQQLVEEVNSRKLTVCEVGSRNVSPGATTNRDRFPQATKFIGVDVHMASNVDIAGDAHYLHELLGEKSIDAVFSGAVMEHLAYPWLFAASVNRALRAGGLTFHVTHQSWPIHEEPNDFWRFSDNAMRVLFGPETGFETIAAGMHNRTYLYPEERRESFATLPLAVAYSHVFVLARKVRDIDPEAVRWPVAKADAGSLAKLYPGP